MSLFSACRSFGRCGGRSNLEPRNLIPVDHPGITHPTELQSLFSAGIHLLAADADSSAACVVVRKSSIVSPMKKYTEFRRIPTTGL